MNLLTEGERRGRAYLPPAGTERIAQLNTLFEGRSQAVTTEAEADEFAGVAVGLRAVFTAIAARNIDAAARQVNGMLKATGAHPSLQRHDGQAWHIHFHAADERSLADNWAAGYATALAIVVGGEHVDRLGVCTAAHCDRVYVDTSRNGSKRFCSTACQNRIKAAAFREARREAAAGE
ncbi:CGNR zinc finger domain-containing protein [Pseudofrankia asymbiotica]|uniref:CGNR zinc finger domain-containing protein n=1 Tax=Pseudofrankia asymbiotica TaxID=1834516 RepID=UPI0018E9E8E1|nr:CGNR zinc finger domain-containing protein [Pseudofrankia asymbiotica]